MTDAFWVDSAYDRENASDGLSRFGAYLEQAAKYFEEEWDWVQDFDHADAELAVRYAEIVWRRATGPVMAPGYIRHHPRTLSSSLERSNWDGALIARLALATEPQARLARLSWGGWDRDGDRWVEPYEQQAAKRPHMLTTTNITFPLPTAALFRPSVRPVDLYEAQQCVDVLIALVNSQLQPVMDVLGD